MSDITQCYGFGNPEDEYLVGDWDGDGRDNSAVRRDNAIIKDTDFDGLGNVTQLFGDGQTNSFPARSTPLPQCSLSIVAAVFPLVVQSSALVDIFSHVRGNNDMPKPVNIGVQDFAPDGYVFKLEEDATLSQTQATIVLMNRTSSTKIAIGIASGQCNQPTNLSVAPGAVGQMTLSTASASTLILRRMYCGFFCFQRTPQDVLVFDENKFWSALGGKKLTIDWFSD